MADVFGKDALEADTGRLGIAGRVRFLDAMDHGASGLASVTTRVAGTSPVVVDGETGILVAEKDPAALSEALAALITDERRRTEYGRKALISVARFSWDKTSKEYSHLIRAILDSKQPRFAG